MELRHAVAVEYYDTGEIKYGSYLPAGIAEGSIRKLDKVETFKLLSLVVHEMQKDKEITDAIQKAKEEQRQRDENQLKWHRYVENESLIESGKMSSSSAHVSNHISAEEEFKKKTFLWTPQGERMIETKLMEDINR